MLYLTKLFKRSLITFIDLTRIMLPIMIIVRIGQEFGILEILGTFLGPIMAIAGLPSDAGLVWAITLFTGVHGGIGAYLGLMPNMDLSIAQHSILCTMMLFAHSIPVEQAIVRKAGVSFVWTTLLRVAASLLYGAAIAWFCKTTGFLSESAEFAWLTSGFANPDWLSWSYATAQSLLYMIGVITVMFVGLDVLEIIGVTGWITRRLEPILAAIGVDEKLAPLTTIGMLLGLTYGAGLIIQSIKENKFSKRSLFLALSCLSLSHGLIEDTAMMLAIGADIWVVLVGRLVFTVVIIAAIAYFWKHVPNKQFEYESSP